VARARWLAEVAESLGQAERLLDRLNLSRSHDAVVVDLTLRIAVAQREVESLRM